MSGCSAWILMVAHFIAAQLLGIIMFYVGLRSYLALNSNWTATHLFIATNEKASIVAWRDSGSLGALLDCVLSNSYTMISTFSNDFAPACIGPIGTAEMYGINSKFNIVVSAVNCLGLFLVVFFITTLVYELHQSGATNIGQGKYLAFTYKVQENKTFRFLSWFVTIFICCVIGDTFRFLTYLYFNGDSGYLINFSEFLLPTLLTLGYSAYSLGSAKVEPFFDYESEEFLGLQFSRGWSEIMTDNNTYGKNLGLALLKQKRGQDKDLKDMLQDWMVPACSDIKAVVVACDKQKEPTEKDSLMKAA